MIHLSMKKKQSLPSFHLCEHCGKTPKSDEELPFIDQQDIEGMHRDKGRISKCRYCGHLFLEYDIDYLFYGEKTEFRATDWVPLIEEEADLENYRLHIQGIVTKRDHLYKRKDGSFAWRRLQRIWQPKDMDDAMSYALDELSERAARKGTGWSPAWDEMNGDERREYMDFLENIAAEERCLPPSESAVPRRTRVYEGEAGAEFLRAHQHTEEEILEGIGKRYYKEYFSNDYRKLMELHGHSHGEKGTYISIQLLTKDNIRKITGENYPFFFCFLSLTILLDELMYTHFQNEYPTFRKATMYPKVEYGITWHHAHPWHILRTLPKGNNTERMFRQCAEIFLRECKEFFRREAIQSMTWERIQQGMRDDPDIGRDIYGSVFKDALRRICMEETRPPRLPVTPEQQESR